MAVPPLFQFQKGACNRYGTAETTSMTARHAKTPIWTAWSSQPSLENFSKRTSTSQRVVRVGLYNIPVLHRRTWLFFLLTSERSNAGFWRYLAAVGVHAKRLSESECCGKREPLLPLSLFSDSRALPCAEQDASSDCFVLGLLVTASVSNCMS